MRTGSEIQFGGFLGLREQPFGGFAGGRRRARSHQSGGSRGHPQLDRLGQWPAPSEADCYAGDHGIPGADTASRWDMYR